MSEIASPSCMTAGRVLKAGSWQEAASPSSIQQTHAHTALPIGSSSVSYTHSPYTPQNQHVCCPLESGWCCHSSVKSKLASDATHTFQCTVEQASPAFTAGPHLPLMCTNWTIILTTAHRGANQAQVWPNTSQLNHTHKTDRIAISSLKLLR